MSGWHIFELFALPPSVRSEYYVWMSADLQDKLRCCCVLTVPIAPVFVCYFNVVLRDDGDGAAIGPITVAEYVIIVLLCLSEAVRDGAVGVTCIELPMDGNGLGVIGTLPSDVRR